MKKARKTQERQLAFDHGRKSPVFGKPCFGLGDTRHFVILVVLGGLRSKVLAFVGRLHTRHFRRFPQNPFLFMAGETNPPCAQTTVFATPITPRHKTNTILTETLTSKKKVKIQDFGFSLF